MTQSHTHKEDEALRVVTDAEADEIANTCFRELTLSGYNGGMGGQTWDRALVRTALAASRPVAVGGSAAWVPSKRDQSLCPPEYRDYGGGYQHGYTSGWNDCLRRIEEERGRTTKAGGAS